MIAVPGRALPLVSVDPSGSYCHPSRDAHPLAPLWLSLLLALEVTTCGGRPQIEAGLRALIRRMSMDNPLWGAPRIHGELLKLGFEVAQSSVAKYMVKRRGPPSQGWRTFLRNHAPEIAAMDPDHPTPLAPSEDLSYELTPLDEAKRYGFIGICEIDAWNQQECEAWMRHNTAGGDEMTLTTRRLFRGSASPTRAWHVYVVPADRD
jgi:hypothetical protein